MLIAAIVIVSHNALLSLRLRREPMTRMPPNGRNTAEAPKLKLSGREAGVWMEMVVVTAVVLLAVVVNAGGAIEQLT